MSKKYSTDEMIDELLEIMTSEDELRKAIIARLRAGDRLCEAAGKVDNKSLMKVAEDLDISFSAAKVCYDKGYRDAIESLLDDPDEKKECEREASLRNMDDCRPKGAKK